MLESAIIFFLLITITAPLLGKYIAFIYTEKKPFMHSKNPSLFSGQNWRQYFSSLMAFNLICIIVTFCIIYFQEYLPAAGLLEKSLGFSAAINAAISFSTGTFWQSHNGVEELTMFSQIFALTMQNFLSGATGISVFIAFIRGITNNRNSNIGNFYDDFIKAMAYILLPLATIVSLVMISYGVVFDFSGNVAFINLENVPDQIYLGPVAAQVSIKTIMANGGSFFASASAHPFEVPSREVVMISLFLVVLVPIAMIFTYGFMVGALSLSWALYFIVTFIMTTSLYVMYMGETQFGLPLILNDNQLEDNFNYAGKELIYDKFPSLMWILSITMSSCGSPNACLENFSPLSTLVMFSNLVMSKFVIEGVGSGFFAMLSYLIVAVFLRGLITGETANFFGKRITINEINYVVIVFLIMPVGVLLFTGITLLLPYSKEIITYGGSQAVTDITYNFASSFVNNGSSFSGINIATNYFNLTSALAMFIGRYPIIYFSLAISGSFASKRRFSSDINMHSQSSLELSVFLLITVILVGAIMYTPLMILGPLLEFINLS